MVGWLSPWLALLILTVAAVGFGWNHTNSAQEEQPNKTAEQEREVGVPSRPRHQRDPLAIFTMRPAFSAASFETWRMRPLS